MTTPSPYSNEFPEKRSGVRTKFFLGIEDDKFFGEVTNLTQEQLALLETILEKFKLSSNGMPEIVSIIIKRK